MTWTASTHVLPVQLHQEHITFVNLPCNGSVLILTVTVSLRERCFTCLFNLLYSVDLYVRRRLRLCVGRDLAFGLLMYDPTNDVILDDIFPVSFLWVKMKWHWFSSTCTFDVWSELGVDFTFQIFGRVSGMRFCYFIPCLLLLICLYLFCNNSYLLKTSSSSETPGSAHTSLSLSSSSSSSFFFHLFIFHHRPWILSTLFSYSLLLIPCQL